MGDAAAPALRCFVALQPDQAALERLDRLADEQHARFPMARRMRRENLHLTLAFIGALQAERARQVAARLAVEEPSPFDWSLDELGAFAGARVLWVGGAEAQLEALALPFAYLHARGGGISLKVFGGIMLGIGFVLMNNLAGHIGMLRGWTPWIVAAMPSTIFLLMSLAAFAWLVRYR